MARMSFPFASVFVGSALLLAAPLAANPYPAHTTETFRDFEHHYSGAEQMEVARAALDARVPAGTPVAEARATLRKAGATCRGATCTYNTFGSSHDMRHSVHWTVNLDAREGAVHGLDVQRETRGS
ncbi:hypothetical protein [Sphingomonas nostoxanthinifaciens]|uniref:hypothetical protein n=1 Tax=Sphingomonas nostoxanthinifaciens TaxID=2872652 RepID=UPI001CC1E102|nr:hypothetical protein [Sphingomonas nostoxanthinifaciens]UAK25093.1 hypothetical protein K8P63_02450 [Sphingomonas nostoxanthinifaciens]